MALVTHGLARSNGRAGIGGQLVGEEIDPMNLLFHVLAKEEELSGAPLLGLGWFGVLKNEKVIVADLGLCKGGGKEGEKVSHFEREGKGRSYLLVCWLD